MSMEQERRVGPARMSVSTIVDIGAGADGSASFEAEAVDVTTGGMRLNTAYLPEQDEPVVCRFEGMGGEEIVVQGLVAWRQEEAMGGEFGVRFTEIDQASLDALHELVGETQVQHADDTLDDDSDLEEPPRVAQGDKVNLHVDEHAKPMKALVHSATSSDVVVSRRLDLLQLDQEMEVEHGDTGDRRPAQIERVSIEVDAESKIPSLIISLRYLDVQGAEVHEDKDTSRETLVSLDNVSVADDDNEAAYEDDDRQSEGPAALAWGKLKDVGPTFAAFGVMAKNLGGKAKDIAVKTIDKAKTSKKTGDIVDDDEPKPSRRTTAPPPKGALRVNGSRETHSVNEPPADEPEEEQVEARPSKKITRKAAIVALSVLLVTIVSLAVARKAMSPGEQEKQATAQTVATPSGLVAPAGLPATTGAVAAVRTPGASALVANVPLFGPTPMTATGGQPAAGGALAAAGGATPPKGDAADKGTIKSAAAAAVDDEALEGQDDEPKASAKADDQQDDEADDTTEETDKPRAHKSNRSHRTASRRTKKGHTSFGRGKLRHPVVYSLRMNRKIHGLKGSASSKGFTVTVEGARSKQGAARIRRLDRRVAKASIVNHGKNARLTIRFKGKAPGYRVQARGSTLRIILSGNKRSAKARRHSGKRRRK